MQYCGLKYFGISLVLLAIIVSCRVTHNGMITAPQSAAVNEDITYVDKVFGYSRVVYVFGIGGWNSHGLANQSMKNLRLSVDLNDGHYLENVTYDIRTDWTFFPFYVKKEALVSADLVKKESEHKVSYSDDYTNFMDNPKTNRKDSVFDRNEMVLITEVPSSIKYAKVVAFRKKRIGIAMPNSQNRYSVRFVRKFVLYKIKWEKNEAFPFSCDEQVILREDIVQFHNLKNAKAEVKGYNPAIGKCIVKASNGKFLRLKTHQLSVPE